ncbi:MAG: calcium-binding protein, partial [Caulobacteraceae bacterium]
SGVIDVTDIFGDATHQAFLVDSQAHYPVADPSVVEGGQLMLMLVETPHDGNKFDNAVNGSYGADTLTGKAGDDTILGGSNDDVLKGANGADSIDGGAGNDKLNGGDGTDTIKGGAGQDFLTGGAGADVFVFSVLEASAPALADRIGDLSDSDVIDLSGIDANSLVAGDQAFTLVGSFSGGVAGQAVLNYDADSNVTQLILDVNGDTIADMFIAIRGDHSDFANFVL